MLYDDKSTTFVLAIFAVLEVLEVLVVLEVLEKSIIVLETTLLSTVVLGVVGTTSSRYYKKRNAHQDRIC